MFTAAIEWIAKGLYPDGIAHSPKTESAIEKVGKELEEKIAGSTGKIKDQYKFLRNVLGSDSLSIKQMKRQPKSPKERETNTHDRYGSKQKPTHKFFQQMCRQPKQ